MGMRWHMGQLQYLVLCITTLKLLELKLCYTSKYSTASYVHIARIEGTSRPAKKPFIGQNSENET
jgi:hypothetical protein